MKVTEIAAWWGAVIASLVLAWDIYKWKRSGPFINVSASPNMKIFGSVPGGNENKTYVVVEVTNIGNQKTTLTHLVSFHYSTLLRKIRKKHDKCFFVPTPALSQPLPHILDAGERWLGAIEQNEELEEFSRNGYLLCGVCHSSGKKAILQRVVAQKGKKS